jgi:hypothetical protein
MGLAIPIPQGTSLEGDERVDWGSPSNPPRSPFIKGGGMDCLGSVVRGFVGTPFEKRGLELGRFKG